MRPSPTLKAAANFLMPIPRCSGLARCIAHTASSSLGTAAPAACSSASVGASGCGSSGVALAGGAGGSDAGGSDGSGGTGGASGTGCGAGGGAASGDAAAASAAHCRAETAATRVRATSACSDRVRVAWAASYKGRAAIPPHPLALLRRVSRSGPE